MPQYSVFTHGNALVTESPAELAGQIKVGWGTQVTFRPPASRTVGNFEVFDSRGPGSWFHLPLTSTLTTFGRQNPYLASVTLLFDTSHCRITNVHVYDGVRQVAAFDNLGPFGLKGSFLETRNRADVDPEFPGATPQSFPNTLALPRPHRVLAGIGLSFFACAFREDFNVGGFSHDPRFHGPLPPAVLVVAAAGAQFVVDERSLITMHIGDLVSLTVDRRGTVGP